MDRLRFFDGQLLTAKDFQAEQDYQIAKRRLHNRMLHGVGVVNGLAVSVDDGTGTVVLVSPGFALDCNGNEILVEGPVRMISGTVPAMSVSSPLNLPRPLQILCLGRT